ncbi:Uncharacterised protein [Vibrio cholerae]|nr:Uncharacterised protein [Vibrio cholerae]CSI69694.1 Uncharacterised protein [Vibrio cholerae]
MRASLHGSLIQIRGEGFQIHHATIDRKIRFYIL